MEAKLEQFSFDDFKCHLCEKYLTVCPLFCISKDGKEYKCGRCKEVPSALGIRNFPLEKLIGHVPLPCSYQDCEEKLVVGEVEEHEEKCQHRIFPCPLSTMCQDTMKLNGFKSHFQGKHEQHWFENEVSYDLSVNADFYVCCLFSYDILFNIFIFREEIFGISHTYVGIYTSADFNGLEYELRVSDCIDSEVPFVSYRGNIIKYKEHDHCLKCIQKNCEVKFHTGKNKILLAEMLQFNIQDVIKILTDNKPVTELRYKICIKRINQVLSSNREPINYDQLNLRKALVCPNCSQCLTATKYCCPFGHVLCEMCRNKLYQCSVCDPPLPLTKNYAFEKLIQGINLLCVNCEKGCDFTGKVHEVRDHEIACPNKE